MEDIETRINGFNEEVRPLLGKYKLGLGAKPVITQDGRVSAMPVLIDIVEKEKGVAEEGESREIKSE